MRFWKLPLLSLVYTLGSLLGSSALAASVRYECTTQGVPLFDSENRQISDQRENDVIYTAGPGVNANISVGDRDFIVWYQENAIAVLKKGQEGMLLHRVTPIDKKAIIKLQMIYLGKTKIVNCEITKL
jgi:hypothetical protein